MNEEHFVLSDDAFATMFEQCALGPIPFTHIAHLRLAWIHIAKNGEAVAIDSICQQLKNYTASVGAADKFNLTMTIAAIKIVSHFMQKSSSHSFNRFLEEFPVLTDNFKELIARHYSIDLFENEAARHMFLEPDLAAFS